MDGMKVVGFISYGNFRDETIQAGEIIAIDKQGVHVACGENTFICLTSVQWPGGKALNTQQIAQTQKLHVGQILP